MLSQVGTPAQTHRLSESSGKKVIKISSKKKQRNLEPAQPETCRYKISKYGKDSNRNKENICINRQTRNRNSSEVDQTNKQQQERKMRRLTLDMQLVDKKHQIREQDNCFSELLDLSERSCWNNSLFDHAPEQNFRRGQTLNDLEVNQSNRPVEASQKQNHQNQIISTKLKSQTEIFMPHSSYESQSNVSESSQNSRPFYMQTSRILFPSVQADNDRQDKIILEWIAKYRIYARKVWNGVKLVEKVTKKTGLMQFMNKMQAIDITNDDI